MAVAGRIQEVTLHMPHRLLIAAGLATLLLLAGVASPSVAQAPAPHGSPGAPAEADDAAAAPAADPLGRSTPEGAVAGFLEASAKQDYARAAEYLDLRSIPGARRAREGAELARQLKRALDGRGFIERWSLSADRAGTLDDGLPPDRERVGSLRTDDGRLDIVLIRLAGDPGEGPVWKFSAATLGHAQEVASGLTSNRLETMMPERLTAKVFDVALWQWIALAALAVASALASWLAVRGLRLALRLLLRSERHAHWRLLTDRAAAPLQLLLGILIFGFAVAALGVSIFARQYLGQVLGFLTVGALTWIAVRVTELGTEALTRRLAVRGRLGAVSMMPLLRRASTAVLVVLGVITALGALSVNVTPALAALGVGGLAVALAAQKTIENLFGGVTLVTDQPVRVGDFCRFGDRVGTIEDIGMRSTRVRTLERTVVTVPNAEFAGLHIENFSARDRYWFHPTIGVRYETSPDQIRLLLVEIRSMLYAHPRVSPSPARIRFVGFGESSLNLDIFAYVTAADFDEFLEVQEDLLLRIMAIVDTAGTAIAFPSRTMYIATDPTPAEQGRAAASATVQAWRDRRDLQLPRFSPDRIQGLKGTLPYPPPGAAVDGAPQ